MLNVWSVPNKKSFPRQTASVWQPQQQQQQQNHTYTEKKRAGERRSRSSLIFWMTPLRHDTLIEQFAKRERRSKGMCHHHDNKQPDVAHT